MTIMTIMVAMMPTILSQLDAWDSTSAPKTSVVVVSGAEEVVDEDGARSCREIPGIVETYVDGGMKDTLGVER